MDEDALMNEAAVADAHKAMMDDNMDAAMDGNLDDLFGEAAEGLAADALGVPMPSTALPSSVVLRIMDMQTRGCCTKLAWANTGSIAQIKDNGRNVVFRALMRNLKTGSWELTDESKHPILAPEDATFEHLEFSGIGIDLAIVDSRGVVHLHTLVGALGKMRDMTSNIPSADSMGSDLDAVVGMHWLPLYPMEFKIPYISPAVKIGDRWETDMRMRDSNEPTVHHAADGKHALLYVTRDARLTLMYQNEHTWQSTSARLANINSSQDLVSHAAMGPEGATLLVVTHDLDGRFRLYKITIVWNQMQHPTTQGVPPTITVAPTLEIGHLTMLEHVAPQHATAARLSGLHVLPRIPSVAMEPGSSSLSTILAVFTRASIPSDATQQAPEAFSVIARWNVETVVPTLHEAFSKLKTNGKTNVALPSQNPVTMLRRQEDNITNKLVLSMESQSYGTMLAFGSSDGTIEFRDRLTLTSIEPYGDTTTISSLPQAGFEQMMTDHNTHIAMSADGSAMGMVKSDGSFSHKMMILRYSWQPIEHGIGDAGDLVEAAVACLARQYTILSCSNTANDETLALLPFDLSLELRTLFIKEIITTMKRFGTLDISMLDSNKQQMMVIREPLLPRALSAQFAMGTTQGTMNRDFAGKFAFAFLNMRVACTAIAQLVARPDAQVRPEFLISLRGNIKWGCDVLVYLIDYLVNLTRHLGRDVSGLDAATFTQAFADDITTSQSPVLHLLLCTWTRCYIRFLNSFIPKYLSGTTKITSNPRSIHEKQVMEETYHFGTSLPFKFTTFEPFIAAVDTAVREAYTTQSIPSERRAEIELDLITSTTIPEELHPAIQTIITSALPKLMESTDATALYSRDTSWIGIEPTPASKPTIYNPDLVEERTVGSEGTHGSGSGMLFDIIRKLPLSKGAKIRRCRRCPAVMEDITPERAKEMPTWFTHAQRHCVCGNYWLMDEEFGG